MLSSNRLVSAFKPWRAARLIFRVGRKVEVYFEEESLLDVWFPATVLEDLGNDLFLVEYQCLGINGEAELRKVTVDHLHIRPSAPRLRDKSFVLLEKVDAFYDFGWWSGVVTKELADSRYVVFFKHTNKERELSHLELRPHVEWKDDKWFSFYQDPICNDVHGAENDVKHGESSSVKCSTEGRATVSLNLTEPIEHTTPIIDKQSSVVISSMKRTKPTSPGSNDKRLRPSKKLKAGISADDPSLSNMSPNVEQSKEVSNPPVDPSGGCKRPFEVAKADTEKTITSDQTFSHGKKMRSKREKGVKLNRQMMNSARKKGRLTADFRGLEALPQGATDDSAKITTLAIVEKEHATKDLPIPVIIGLQCKKMTVSRSKKLQQLPIVNTPIIAEVETQESGVPLALKNVERKEAAVEITPKRKRGRPPKSQAKSPETSLAVNHQNGDVVPGAVVVEGSKRNAIGSTISAGTQSEKEHPVHEKEQLKLTGNDNATKQKNTSRTMMGTPLVNVDKLPNGSSGKTLTVQPGRYKSVKGKRGKQRTISSINIESSTQDSFKEKANGGLEKDSAAGNSELPSEKSPDTMSDDQPLSRWFEGMHISTTVDGAAAAPQRTVEQSSETSKKEFENFKFPLAEANGDTGAGDDQNLPFVKSTSLWQTIESMAVFRMMPQKPHFRPLDSVKESAREGQAICSMVNFSSVVEKTFGLRLDNPRSVIEDCLETLVELESHGFDVKMIRNRLTGLLLIKDKQEKLEAQSRELREKIEEQNVEGRRIDEEIDVLDKQIRELQERRAQVLSKKKKGSEISALEAEVDGINEEMCEARLKFDGLAAAPW